MTTKYRQITLKDTFQTVRTCLWKNPRPSSSSLTSILTFRNLFRLSLPMPFTSILAGNAPTLWQGFFEPFIELMFRQMVDFTEPICQLIDSSLAQVLTFDTSGIELFVAKNNPKTLNSLIKRLLFLTIPVTRARSKRSATTSTAIPPAPMIPRLP